MALKKLGEMLLEEGIVTREQLDEAIAAEAKSGLKLGPALVKLGYLTEEALHYFLALQYGVDFLELGAAEIPRDAIKSVPREIAAKYRIIPVRREANQITIASADPSDPALFQVREDLLLDSKTEVNFVVSTDSAIAEALEKYYHAGAAREAGGAEKGQGTPAPEADPSKDIVAVQNLLNPEALAEAALQEAMPSQEDEEYDESAVNDAPVIRLVNSLISQAVAKRASDIHLNPFEKNMKVRYRIDGTLQAQPEPPLKYRRAMIARIKVMSKMDIMERRKAQDGRIKIKVQGKVIDLRVSTLPTIYGENVVMRILDQESLQLDMTKLGFEPEEMAIYQDAISQPYGLVLHTGPTGSGKTTTLYSALSFLNDPAKAVSTIEDPVEYQLPGIIQCQVNNDADLTFANILRTGLRQDPNIIMLGEIRDTETATTAIKAALTGHLMLSTLHTNDAPSTVMRLVDMGVDRIDAGTALLIVVAQRLIKKICQQCKEPVVPNQEDLDRIMVKAKDIDGLPLYHGAGCSNCNGSGYRGRMALYEIMRITPVIREAIFKGADLNELTQTSISQGMNTLRMLAVRKWKMGITTIEEILRVTAAE